MMGKKKGRILMTRIKSKPKLDLCQDCNMYYKGVIKDGSGKVLKTISCKNSCPWRM